MAILALPSPGRADHLIRLDTGMFNGKLSSTYKSNTSYPYDTAAGSYLGIEFEKGGPHLRFLIGGSLERWSGAYLNPDSTGTQYPATVGATNFGDIKIGFVAATSWVEWRFILSHAQTPALWVYNWTADNGLPGSGDIPLTLTGNYFRVESVMYAKANAYRLAFHYYFAVLLGPITLPDTASTPLRLSVNGPADGSVPVGGTATENYFLGPFGYLGGCVRVFAGGDKFRIGPSICVDLQEMNLPNQVIYRQEVSGRLTTEF